MFDFQQISRYRENNRLEAKLATGGLPRSIWVAGGLPSVGAAAQHGVELCPGTVVVPVTAAAVGAAGQVAADVDRALILLRRGHRDGRYPRRRRGEPGCRQG